MYENVVADATSHPPMFWLNLDASSNICVKSVIAETSQSARGWLNNDAPKNIEPNEVAEETFHPLMF